jgi:diguanylate cyclase (GGDEF)-like protein
MTNITFLIPQMIIVFGEDNRDVLYANKSASEALALDGTLKGKLTTISERFNDGEPGRYDTGLSYDNGEGARYLSIDFYLLQWSGQNAKAFVLSDISDDIEHVRELELHAYQDNLTGLHNRFFGMQMLNRWIDENRVFSLCFADLDNLKYVNDTYGHCEGDIYIKSSARCLEMFSPDCITCRLGGDEFMVLAPGLGEAATHIRMQELCSYLLETNLDKPYFCRISYGIVEVKADNVLPANMILSLADERMYTYKRLNKRARKL